MNATFLGISLCTALILSLSACKKSDNECINGDVGYIALLQCVDYRDHDLTICCMDMNEIRCPCYADCIVAGNISATLKISTDDGIEKTVTLITNGNQEGNRWTDTLDNKVVYFVGTNDKWCSNYGEYDKYKLLVKVEDR
jgi:hypothetical protein